ncbi:MAG: ATP synthase F0 subunit C [Nitrospinae bacterium]|nr:ATP synthase F0 subunit C [Nitrospinota bacterium]
MKKLNLFLLALTALVAAAPAAFAQEAEAAAAAGGSSSGALTYMALGCVVGLGLAALGGGIGMGHAISGALSAMARNPGFYQRLFPNMLIGLALIESLVIYTLVIVLILLYANPIH